MWIERRVREKIDKAVASRPIVLLTGARQTGKNSLLKRSYPKTPYITFDHLREVEAAKGSPEYFLSRLTDQVILDEIQYVPELFRELKIFVDEDRQNYGKWILTGSQRFELMEKIGESLAGRISIINLETLSASELRDSKRNDIESHLWKGGYPEIWSNLKIDTDDFFESYIRTYIERDLKQIIEVKNLNDFRRFFKAVAVRIGQLLNYKDLSNDVGVSDITIKKWVHALELSGLLIILPPFYSNIGKRLVKSPKVYFADHGLASYLLGIKNTKEWYTHIYRGNLWENFVVMELIKNSGFVPGENLFFYRDQNGVEIDFLVQQGEKIYFIEAKSSERVESKKINFKKVTPLFREKVKTETIVAQNINAPSIVKQKDYFSYNPLWSTYTFS